MKSLPALACLACILTLAVPAQATDFHSIPGPFRLAPAETISNEFWAIASTFDLQGQAQDDLFLLSGSSYGAATNAQASIRFSGTALGDVWAAGDGIETSGLIRRHARLLGYRFIQAGGTFERNLMAAGGTISLPTNSAVAGDAWLAGREVIVEGTVSGRTRIYAESITLSGSFGGPVTLSAPQITITPGTRIGGDLLYRSTEDLMLDSNVTLGGKMIRLEDPAPVRRGTTLNDVTMQMFLCAAALLTGLLVTALFPAIMVSSLQRLTLEFWKSLLLGVVAFCLIPMASFFLLFTLVGIPLSVLALFAYAILVYTGKIAGALWLGHRILYRRGQPAVVRLFPLLALGLLLIYAAALLPFPIDILVWFGFTLPGMGALAGAIMDRRSMVIMAVPQSPVPAPPPLPGGKPGEG